MCDFFLSFFACARARFTRGKDEVYILCIVSLVAREFNFILDAEPQARESSRGSYASEMSPNVVRAWHVFSLFAAVRTCARVLNLCFGNFGFRVR